jgi:methionyl-tRNA synthetase
MIAAKDEVIRNYENLNFAAAVRTITALADLANKYVEQNQPWAMIKTDLEKTLTTLTATINAVHIITIYLKPILPKFAEKIEKFLNVGKLSFTDVDKLLENHKINTFERLIDRVEKEKVDAMVEESKESQVPQPVPVTLSEPIAPECTIEDFAKIDLRIAKVIKAEAVAGADKLLYLKLDLGGVEKNVFAGIAQAYKPQDLMGKIVICLANLKPRKMKFGISEGMILAAGAGGKDIFMLTADAGVVPGQRIK